MAYKTIPGPTVSFSRTRESVLGDHNLHVVKHEHLSRISPKDLFVCPLIGVNTHPVTYLFSAHFWGAPQLHKTRYPTRVSMEVIVVRKSLVYNLFSGRKQPTIYIYI